MSILEITKEDARIIGEHVGAATMCWKPRPTGVFDSEAAATHLMAIQDHVSDMMARAYEQGRKDQEDIDAHA